jgi:hypothetical protein
LAYDDADEDEDEGNLPPQTKFEEVTDCSRFHLLKGLHLTWAKWQMKVTNLKSTFMKCDIDND